MFDIDIVLALTLNNDRRGPHILLVSINMPLHVPLPHMRRLEISDVCFDSDEIDILTRSAISLFGAEERWKLCCLLAARYPLQSPPYET
jgi:hypothetical protein